ncbi:Error-prone repair protein ImuA [Pedobacter aquatilis]|uniref:ImuA family protein n=1 Tax=Pedobacter aquatilis TaxID=351343 RepID=UPI0029310957|nr:Error-prone repair protein ImuA [Pedobacter aquatilis]
MRTAEHKKDLIDSMRKEILKLEGFKFSPEGAAVDFGLGGLVEAFPNGQFPTGAIHEFIGTSMEDAASTGGFTAALLSVLMKDKGICIYVSAQRKLFPPALARFGLSPDRMVFIDLGAEKDVLWATEEALKCESLSAVVMEIDQISFAQSRRLQLVVEKSKVSCFIIRRNAEKLSSTTTVARWQISALSSETIGGMPGLGFPRWKVELLKVKNGKPGNWEMEYVAGGFRLLELEPEVVAIKERKVV